MTILSYSLYLDEETSLSKSARRARKYREALGADKGMMTYWENKRSKNKLNELFFTVRDSRLRFTQSNLRFGVDALMERARRFFVLAERLVIIRLYTSPRFFLFLFYPGLDWVYPMMMLIITPQHHDLQSWE